jgi:hypothetical protein
MAVAGGVPATAGDSRTRGVVELFTSQGCSSCPPADALMTKLSGDPSLVTLSFAVDYWNYLGWKDTFSRPEFTQRQRDYASARGDRDVYTPQVVVDGQDHAIGSDADRIAQAIALRAPGGRLPVPVSAAISGDSVFAQIGGAAGSDDTKATVWLVKYNRRQDVAIGRGENSGRTVTYANIVTEMQPVGVWKGTAMQIELPRSVIMAGNNTGFALILQTAVNGKPGPILGATVLTDGPRS